MSILRMIYLALACAGAAQALILGGAENLPVLALFSQSGSEQLDPISWNAIIATTALSVWIIAEVWVRKNWLALIALPATFLCGLSLGLPLYLFLRTRPV